MKLRTFITIIAGLCFAAQAGAQSRNYIDMAGSSTVYPFATSAAERFGKQTHFRTPKIEQTGTGGGFKLFCAGIGPRFTDIANASRRIKKSEIELCAQNGVKEIIELQLGFDGVVLANAKTAPLFNLTQKELFLALAKTVPNPENPTQLIANPYQRWNQIRANLPADKIEILGPPPTSGTRDTLVELVMSKGCAQLPAIAELEQNRKEEFRAICHTIREDGAFIEAGENDNLIVQKLATNPKALGIFGYSFLEENMDKVKGNQVEGVSPTFEDISNGKYSVSRPLYMYIKKAHIPVIPGMKELLEELVDEETSGEEGYLADKGLIPLQKSAFRKRANNVKEQRVLKLD